MPHSKVCALYSSPLTKFDKIELDLTAFHYGIREALSPIFSLMMSKVPTQVEVKQISIFIYNFFSGKTFEAL